MDFANQWSWHWEGLWMWWEGNWRGVAQLITDPPLITFDMKHVICDLTCDTWHVMHKIWHVTCHMPQVTCHVLQVTQDMWHVTYDTWHMTHHTSASPLSHPYHLHIFIVFIIFVNSIHRYRLGVTFPFNVQGKCSCNSVNTLIWDHNCWQTDGCVHIITVSNVPRNCPITQDCCCQS